jgi:threonine/homoserine/homoserine lactone efflux protein
VLLSISNAVTMGVRASVLSSLGNVAGLLCLSGAALLGVGTILQASPVAFAVLKVLGAAYLVYLGIRKWGGGGGLAGDVLALPRHRTHREIFVQGALVALSNPKAILFFVALFPQFVAVEQPLLPQFLRLTGTLAVFSFSALMSYAVLAGFVTGWLAVGTRSRNFQRLSGCVFIALGVLMLRL